MPNESNHSVDDSELNDSELNDLEDSYSEIKTTTSPSPSRGHERTRSPARHGGVGVRRSSYTSDRFRRTSTAPSSSRSNGHGNKKNGSATKMWKKGPRGSDKIDQSVNIMDKTAYEMKDSNSTSKRGDSRRSERTRPDNFWESQSLNASASSIDPDYIDSYGMDDSGNLHGGKKKSALEGKWRLFCVLLGAGIIIAVLMLTLPRSGLVHSNKAEEETNPPATTPPPEATPPKTTPPETTPPSTVEEGALTEEEEEALELEPDEDNLEEGGLTEEEEEALDLAQVPQASRLDAFRFYVIDQDISEQAQLDIMGSPSKKALHWVTQQDPAQMEIPGLDEVATNDVEAEYALLQRYALAVFYFSQQVASSTSPLLTSRKGGLRQLQLAQTSKVELENRQAFDESWLSVEPICQWHGVVCADDFETVVEVNLPKHMLQGTIPRELLVGAAMPGLKKVDLTHNKLHGELPVVTQEREEAGVNLGVPPHSSTLQVLNLGSNRLTGSIDAAAGFAQLEVLALEHNDFSGTIPDSFGDLNGLRVLYLDGNGIDGTVPTQLGQLIRLEELHLQATKVSGEMPEEVCVLRESGSAMQSLVTPCKGITCDCCTKCF